MSEPKPRVAVVDDESAQRALLARALEDAGYEPMCCEDGEAALEVAHEVALMLLDVRMPGISGLEVLERLSHAQPELPIILLTAFIDVKDAVAAIKQGAVDYLEKPVDLDELTAAVDDTLQRPGRKVSEPDWESPDGVVAVSPLMKNLFQQATRAAKSDASVLLTGESGTGKEVLATYLHRQSGRSTRPFVRVDCGALPENLIEAELFGHERGAYTGADRPRPGRFEEADGGTIFLDEVGELPLFLQPKFLGALENGRIRGIGAREDRPVDCRVIAATNRNLEAEVAEGRFREDLYYRLSVIVLEVPPLRSHREDILPFAQRLLREKRMRLSPAAERLLSRYDWPGNMRELRNALERATIMANGSRLLPTDFPSAVQQCKPVAQSGSVLVGDFQEIQRRAILEALEKTGGNKTRAAELLGISRRNLIYKLREYGL